MKMITDTLQENGKWSIKRISSFSAFWIAAIYAFLGPLWLDVLEFVFWGFITYSATGILGTVWNKKIEKPNITQS